MDVNERYVVEIDPDEEICWAIRDRCGDNDVIWVHPVRAIETREEAEQIRSRLVARGQAESDRELALVEAVKKLPTTYLLFDREVSKLDS